MHYKITTLVENAVYGRSLQAENTDYHCLLKAKGIKYYSIRDSQICLSATQHFWISILRKWISLSCRMDIAIIQGIEAFSCHQQKSFGYLQTGSPLPEV